MKILVIEDNYILAKNIVRYFNLQNIKSEFVRTWELWFEKLKTKNYSIVILDLNLPWINWLDLLKSIREQNMNLYVIILTSSSTDEDMILGLNLWADDYLSKPFDYNVLLARINAVCRREALNKSNNINLWNVKIDLNYRKVYLKWKDLKLSLLEFNLLSYFVRNKWKILNREEIYENVWWEFENYMFSRVVDIYVGYLRKKLWKDFIKTKKWEWYYI